MVTTSTLRTRRRDLWVGGPGARHRHALLARPAPATWSRMLWGVGHWLGSTPTLGASGPSSHSLSQGRVANHAAVDDAQVGVRSGSDAPQSKGPLVAWHARAPALCVIRGQQLLAGLEPMLVRLLAFAFPDRAGVSRLNIHSLVLPPLHSSLPLTRASPCPPVFFRRASAVLLFPSSFPPSSFSSSLPPLPFVCGSHYPSMRTKG